MTATRYYAVVHFLSGITQELGPYLTYMEAVEAGNAERKGQRHRPLWFEVKKRFLYKD